MTETETARNIIEDGDCSGVYCRNCPAIIPNGCLASRNNGNTPCRAYGGLDYKSSKFFTDFLKSKEAKGMDKTEAIKRLDALDEEAAKLREIIERGDGLAYNDHKVYVVIINDSPYILCGYDNARYFRWHSFKFHGTEQAWGPPQETGQEALDYVNEYDIHVFGNPKEGIQFFYDQYMKAH